MGFRLFSNKKASIGMYITFVITAIIIIVITGLIAPMGVMFSTQMYEAGEQILIDNNATIANINNAQVRQSIYNMTDEALGATHTNIEVNSDLFQYAWVIVLVLAGLIVFIYTRQVTEFRAGGFV